MNYKDELENAVENIEAAQREASDAMDAANSAVEEVESAKRALDDLEGYAADANEYALKCDARLDEAAGDLAEVSEAIDDLESTIEDRDDQIEQLEEKLEAADVAAQVASLDQVIQVFVDRRRKLTGKESWIKPGVIVCDNLVERNVDEKTVIVADSESTADAIETHIKEQAG